MQTNVIASETGTPLDGSSSKASQLKTLTANALDELRRALDQGRSDSLTALLKTMACFHRYSMHNAFLIAAQRPTASRVAGFHTWRKLGRFVRKGEKGIAIMAPITVKRDPPTPGDDPTTITAFRAVYVFDVAQTDGAPLPEPPQALGDPGAQLPRLLEVIRSRNILVDFANDLDGDMGRSYGGRIEILSGQSPSATFSVLVHEFAHELLHRSEDRIESRDTRELEAEAVAFVVSQWIGLDLLDSSRDYIHLYRGDGDALVESLERIQRAASAIIAGLDIAAEDRAA